jgi:DNA transformation protein
VTAADPDCLERVSQHLSVLVPLQTRRYFGGTALVVDDVQFGVVFGSTVYFVVDDRARPRYQDRGSVPFTYRTRQKEVEVHRFYAVPEDVLEDLDTLRAWTLEALAAARAPRCRSSRRGTPR